MKEDIVDKVIKEEKKVKSYDKAMVNYYSNLGLADMLNPVIKQYRKEVYINSSNGQCYNESDKFINWLSSNFSNLYRVLETYGIKRHEGYFGVDYPGKLLLGLGHLEKDEYDVFMDLYEDSWDSPKELSELIWDFLEKLYKDDPAKLGDLYEVDHGWVGIDDFIIDFTWEQFKNAIKDTKNLVDRYIKKNKKRYSKKNKKNILKTMLLKFFPKNL
jgi:hypothetical protein